MKRKLKIYVSILGIALFTVACSDFDEINERPDAFPSTEVSAKFFLTGAQILLYAPDRYPYWRAQLIHADRYAGQFTFGFNGSWWTDGLGYAYNSAYTDAAFDWLAGYNSNLTSYMNFVKEGGALENEKYYAIGLIMKGLYYQMFTDTFGMLPYSEASNPDIVTPSFDSQADIYEGVITDLNQAMSIIGSETTTGEGVEILTTNDLFFNGDLQKWKKLANTLKLRMGLRAMGASGAAFAETAVTEAMQAEVLSTADENALLEKDTEISQWANAAYGDVWHNFGGLGSKWKVGKVLIDYLRENNDPRLSKYAQPIVGGTITFEKPTEGTGVALFDKHVNFLIGLLDEADIPYSRADNANSTVVDIAEGEYYLGQPTRLNSDIYTHVKDNMFSFPAEIVTNPKNQGLPISPEIVMTAAEGNFLKAEAILKGKGTGDAQMYYQEGIRQAMLMWNVSEDAISQYLSTEDMALLDGSTEENLEKVAIQRWIADYTDGFEAWAVVRDTGYPSELAAGVSDYDIYSAGDLNGEYPQRLRYGTASYNTNGSNTEAANSTQGPDEQGTDLWWAN